MGGIGVTGWVSLLGGLVGESMGWMGVMFLFGVGVYDTMGHVTGACGDGSLGRLRNCRCFAADLSLAAGCDKGKAWAPGIRDLCVWLVAIQIRIFKQRLMHGESAD